MNLVLKAYVVSLLVWIAFPMRVNAQVTAIRNGSTIAIMINDQYFSRYISSADEKYPFFYPVNAPSGASVTSMRNGTYPHHSSLFFGCDKVNGGNYWQEGLERGQILALQTNVLESGSDKVVIEQECIWTRPDARAPIKDFRTITVRVPSETVYQLDFDIVLEMLMDVQIERTNHSLFSARIDPDLSVVNGGTMINAEGDRGEEATFGKASAWISYHGMRGESIEGITIMQHPSNDWFPAPWFTRDYGFISPTPMYWPADEVKGTSLKQGQVVKLRYRVLVHKGDATEARISEAYDQYKNE